MIKFPAIPFAQTLTGTVAGEIGSIDGRGFSQLNALSGS